MNKHSTLYPYLRELEEKHAQEKWIKRNVIALTILLVTGILALIVL